VHAAICLSVCLSVCLLFFFCLHICLLVRVTTSLTNKDMLTSYIRQRHEQTYPKPSNLLMLFLKPVFSVLLSTHSLLENLFVLRAGARLEWISASCGCLTRLHRGLICCVTLRRDTNGVAPQCNSVENCMYAMHYIFESSFVDELCEIWLVCITLHLFAKTPQM
jgi:hypothetical protein